MLLVVGGHAKGVGKTAVAAGLIGALPGFGWTALKISHHAAAGAPYLLEEEPRPGPADTGRYLAAGGRRAFWLRVRPGCLPQALPAVREILADARHALIESNGIMEFLDPDLYVVVLDFGCGDFKPSARRHLHRAGAFVVIDRGLEAPPWEIPREVWDARPRFRVRPPDYAPPALVDFVRGLAAAS